MLSFTRSRCISYRVVWMIFHVYLVLQDQLCLVPQGTWWLLGVLDVLHAWEASIHPMHLVYPSRTALDFPASAGHPSDLAWRCGGSRYVQVSQDRWGCHHSRQGTEVIPCCEIQLHPGGRCARNYPGAVKAVEWGRLQTKIASLSFPAQLLDHPCKQQKSG